MPKYKIVTGEPVSDESSDPVVELRLVIDGSDPTIQARNPGDGWNNIALFRYNGKLMLSCGADHVAGLQTMPHGEIVTF